MNKKSPLKCITVRVIAIICMSVCLSIGISSSVFAQAKITGVLKGLANSDTAIVRIQKSGEQFFFKKLGGIINSADVSFSFDNLPNGKWSISIDAKGYLYPTAKVLTLNNNTIDNTITLTKAPADSNFIYQWQDDSSYVGHAQQAYINDKVEINILGVAERVPDDFNAINILNEYGFFLSDGLSTWTSEDAYRLYQTLKKLNFRKFFEKDSVVVRAKILITTQKIDRDIDFFNKDGVDFVTISRDAFTYATPQVVTVDGVKGKFFSKRLFTALVYYNSDKGTQTQFLDQLAKDRYGFEFLQPSSTLKQLMNETETNFQQFTADEKILILTMFEEFPDAMQRQDQLKYMVRRINGQPHPVYTTAPAIAWTTNKTIEWMESGFKSQAIEYMQRLILHEKSHFLWAYSFDNLTKSDWSTLGGWFQDPTSSSGWSTTNTTEFVSAYAHLKNPDEDMAESIAFYITNPDALRSRSLKKFEFIRDRIMKGSRYISIIRPDLTFQVYNLFPDYNYPGKIKRTKLEVTGKPEEDKVITLEIELTTMNNAFDGADWASCRFFSSIGTLKDMGLSPVNGNKSILRGSITLSKLAKSGYWTIPQMVVSDINGNMRLENNSTYGVKCFVNNPLEDVTPPLYVQKSLRLDSITAKFNDFGGSIYDCTNCDSIKPIDAIRIRFDMLEKNRINPDGRALVRFFLPTFDSTNKYNIQPYSYEVQVSGNGIKNDFPDSIKTAEFYFPIPEYYPSGYYSISSITIGDMALNYRSVLLDKDTGNKNYFIPPNFANQRALRDSIYFKTKYPDLKPPVIDLNDIRIQATPTNPIAPNGETLFEMWLWIKDESDFPGHGSGFSNGYYTLRDPQGLEHTYTMQSDLPNLFYQIVPDSSIYGYKKYYLKTLLPAGSPPGLWGVSSILLEDHARNKKYYSFTEFVRFDVEQSTVLQVTPMVNILAKKVNASNVEDVAITIGCKSCKDQNYRLRMYSSMGGNSFVAEGKMTADTIQLTKLKLSGVNDGILYATVFMLDSTKALIGTGKAIYTKDTQIPTSQKMQTNINNFGKSNLDSLIIGIKSTELNGTYQVIITQKSIVGGKANNGSDPFTLGFQKANSGVGFAVGDSILLTGNFVGNNFNIASTAIKTLQDGIIELKFVLIDSVGNAGTPILQQLYKDTKDPIVTVKKTTQTGLSSTFTLSINEFVSNSIVAGNLMLTNASFVSVDKVDSKTFKLVVNRSCNDTLGIDVKAGILQDTAGNYNALTVTNYIDVIVPEKPSALPITYCMGSNSIALSANATSGNFLNWYGKDSIGGLALLTAPIPLTTNVGTSNYYVSQKNNATLCESVRTKIVVTVNALPAKPSITKDASGNLVSSSLTNNQWYKNGVEIVGATSSSYKPTEAGNYSVIVVQNGCASPLSDFFNYTVTAVVNLGNGQFLKIYPNPIATNLTIDYQLNGISGVIVTVYDMQGKIVVYNVDYKTGNIINFSQFSSGGYRVRIQKKNGEQLYMGQLLKQ